MNRAQIVALANAIQTIRPDWQQAGIVAQLTILASNWAGSDGALSAHAMVIAAHPQSVTPGAFNAKPPEPVEPPQPRWTSEPNCQVCNCTRSQCARKRAFEISRGVPDPHEFQTLDDYRIQTRGSA